MKRKILVILIAVLVVSTVFGAISSGATIIERREAIRQVLNNDFPSVHGGIGSFGVVVFYRKIIEPSTNPELIFIEDATVTLKDKDGNIYQMIYVEVKPDFYAYVAYEVKEGSCEITASYQGYLSKTINVEVHDGEDLIIRKIQLEEEPDSHPVIIQIINRFTRSFPLLRNLFGQ